MVSAAEIDRINILQATLLAMQTAVMGLSHRPGRVLIDGNCAPLLSYKTQTIIGGDRLIPAISAASILAKVTRDRYMVALHEKFPEYGFAQHKGYPTVQHRQALQRFGITEEHRQSYAPVKALLSPLSCMS